MPASQTGQDFRMCFNAVPINAVTTPSMHHIPECMSVIDELSEATYMSLLDLKGAFFNHVVDPDSFQYLGFVTQDGLFYFIRMPFGCLNSAALLQSSLEFCIHELGPLRTATYFDDITPFGHDKNSTWNTTVKTIARLAYNGYMLNLNKCVFLAKSADLLGLHVWNGRYQLGEKALAKLFLSHIPTDLKGLQGLLGRCNFASRLIPGYKKIVRPIQALLKKSQDAVWTAPCTDALNELFQRAGALITLHIYSPKLPLLFHYSLGEATGEIVVTQIGPRGEYPVTILSRTLTLTEVNATTEIERALSLLHWGIRKAAKYTAYHPMPILAMLRHPEHRALSLDAGCKLRAKFLDILAYGVEFGLR